MTTFSGGNRIDISEIDAGTGVPDLVECDVIKLSGDERARVVLSRVIAQRAPVVLLDGG